MLFVILDSIRKQKDPVYSIIAVESPAATPSNDLGPLPVATIRFQFLTGSLLGLYGSFQFTSLEKGTLVLLEGKYEGPLYIPTWVLVEGSKIVFDFSAKQLRSIIETKYRKACAK